MYCYSLLDIMLLKYIYIYTHTHWAEPSYQGGFLGTRPKNKNQLLPPYIHHIGTPLVHTEEPAPPRPAQTDKAHYHQELRSGSM